MVTSSLLIQAASNAVASVQKQIDTFEGIEIVRAMDCRMAVVLESESTREAAAQAEALRSLDGVQGVELVSHFFEDEAFDPVGQEHVGE